MSNKEDPSPKYQKKLDAIAKLQQEETKKNRKREASKEKDKKPSFFSF